MLNLSAILIIFLLVSCQNESKFKSSIDAILSEKFNDIDPGGIFLIKKGDKTIYQNAFGISDISTKQKIDENTIFNTGSISKTFVSNGILILAEEGKLSLDDPISKYFPDFKNKEIADKIKIHHFLTHSSGIPDLRNVRENLDFFMTAKDKENFEPLKQAEELHSEPGNKFRYSNPAYNGLALIIEQITGMKWQDFIKEHIFKPANMMNSRITDGDHPREGVAHAYMKTDSVYVEYDYGEFSTFAAAGNGGVWCSILDLDKYRKAMQTHVFLSKTMINESQTLKVYENWTDTVPPINGYSWFLDTDYILQKEIADQVHAVYHTGSQGGFRGYFIMIPEKDIFFAGLTNRSVSNWKTMIQDIFAIIDNHNWLDSK